MSDLRNDQKGVRSHENAACTEGHRIPLSHLQAECGSLKLQPEEIEAIAVKPEMETTARIASEFERATV